MHQYRVSRCAPHLLDFVTWAILKGCRLFNRVRVEPYAGLVATDRIEAYDFVSLTPAEATQSLFTITEDSRHFPLLASPYNYGEPLPFFKDQEAEGLKSISRGSFSFICYMAATLLTAQPQGLHGYLRVLPATDLSTSPAVCEAESFFTSADQKHNIGAFHDYVTPIISLTNISSGTLFDRAFCHAFGLFRRHAVPLWSPSLLGSSRRNCMNYFESSAFCRHIDHSVQREKGKKEQKKWSGEIMGLVPFCDFASHATEPNATIGYPDDESLRWIQQERHIKKIPQNGCIALQALKDINPGDIITVNKNAFFNLDSKTFEWWFGFPLCDPLLSPPKGLSSGFSCTSEDHNAFHSSGMNLPQTPNVTAEGWNKDDSRDNRDTPEEVMEGLSSEYDPIFWEQSQEYGTSLEKIHNCPSS